MSVQQVKDRFEELTAYLGRDAKGVEKLKKLKDAVNVLRTNLAAAQEQAACCTTTRQLAVERALAAEGELANTRIEMDSLRQQAANLTRELKAATNVEPTDEGSDGSNNESESVDQTLMTGVIKNVRKRMKYCPAAKCVNHVRGSSTRDKNNRWAAFDRDSLSEGWSHESLWLLGASVALLSSLFGEVRIETDNRLSDFIKEDGQHEGFGRHLIQWMAKNNCEALGMPKIGTKVTGILKQTDDAIRRENINAVLSRGYR